MHYITCMLTNIHTNKHTNVHIYTLETTIQDNSNESENENRNENENAIQYTTLCDIRHKSLCSIIGLLSWVGVSGIYYDIPFRRVVVVVVLIRHVHKRYNPLSQQSYMETGDLWRISYCLSMYTSLSFLSLLSHTTYHDHHVRVMRTYILTNTHTLIHIHTFVYKVLVVSDRRVFKRNEVCRQQSHTRKKVYIAYHNTTRRTGSRKKRKRTRHRNTDKMHVYIYKYDTITDNRVTYSHKSVHRPCSDC
jgi:hypothetical protein